MGAAEIQVPTTVPCDAGTLTFTEDSHVTVEGMDASATVAIPEIHKGDYVHVWCGRDWACFLTEDGPTEVGLARATPEGELLWQSVHDQLSARLQRLDEGAIWLQGEDEPFGFRLDDGNPLREHPAATEDSFPAFFV